MEAVPDAMHIRDELLASLGDEPGARYWSTLRSFIIARLSKKELDAFLRETLNDEQLAMHNAFLRAIVGAAARALPSVRERASAALGARVALGLWGSDRPAVPLVLHQLPTADVPLALPRVFPNRLKPGASVRALPHGRGRVRSCAFAQPPSHSQALALRRRVITALPNEPGAPREISEECLHMLSQSVQCHLRALLSAIALSRHAAEPAGARLAGTSSSGRALVRQGPGGQRLVRRVSLGDLYGALALSRRVSTAAAWQLPLCRTAAPLRWATSNLEAVSSVTGPHLAMAPPRAAPPWVLGAHARGGDAESAREAIAYEHDDDSCERDWGYG